MVLDGDIIMQRESVRSKINGGQIGLWFLSVFFSTLPVIFDGLDYLLRRSTLDKEFFLHLFSRGDILCITATLLVMTLVEYFFNRGKPKTRGWLILLVFSVILWILIFWLWVKIYSIAEGEYDDKIVMALTIIFVAPSLIFCTIFQGVSMEANE